MSAEFHRRVRIDDLCALISEQVDPSKSADALCLGLEHLRPGRITTCGGGRASDVLSSKSIFSRGDVLYGKLRPYLDKAVVAEEDGVCTTELLVLRPKNGTDARFLAGVLHSGAFLEHAISGVTGVQHPRTSWQRIREFELQGFDEMGQRQIGDFITRLHRAITACEATLTSAQALKRVAMRELFRIGLHGETQKDTEIGPVPSSWQSGTIGDHFAVVSGGTPSRVRPDYWTGGSIPWAKTTEIDYGVIRSTEEHITESGLRESAAKILAPGTILMAMYGQGVTRGRVAILGIEAACNQACAAMTPLDEAVEPRYLFHFLAYRYADIRMLAHGGQQQNLNLDIVRDLPVVFANDVREQTEIVEILDAFDRKADLQMRKKALLEELFKELLNGLMTGLIRVADLHMIGREELAPPMAVEEAAAV